MLVSDRNKKQKRHQPFRSQAECMTSIPTWQSAMGSLVGSYLTEGNAHGNAYQVASEGSGACAPVPLEVSRISGVSDNGGVCPSPQSPLPAPSSDGQASGADGFGWNAGDDKGSDPDLGGRFWSLGQAIFESFAAVKRQVHLSLVCGCFVFRPR